MREEKAGGDERWWGSKTQLTPVDTARERGGGGRGRMGGCALVVC